MKTLLIAILAIVLVSCAKAPPPEKFSYNEDINSIVQIVTDFTHGTGFYLGDGLIMTAGHVVPERLIVGYLVNESPVYYYIEKGDDTRKNLEVVWRSEFLDVAICRTRHDHNLVPVKFAEENAKVGDKIHSIGFPSVLSWTYSFGYVMSEKIEWTVNYREHYKKIFHGDYFAVCLAGSGGSSGSPIFSEAGTVVGIYNAKLKDGIVGWGLNLTSLKMALAEWEANNGEGDTSP